MVQGHFDIPNRFIRLASLALLAVALGSCDSVPTESGDSTIGQEEPQAPMLAPIVPLSEASATEGPLPDKDVTPLPGKKPLPGKPSTELAPDNLDLPYDFPHPFPNRVGYWWEYERHNHLTGLIDTVRMEIVDTTTLPNGEQASVWAGEFFPEVWGPYVSIVKGNEQDTVKVYREFAGVYYTASIYVYPLLPGLKWSNLPDFVFGGFDSSQTIPEASVTTPAGEFQSAKRTVRWGADAIEGSIYGWEWLVNGVGIVSLSYKHRGLGGGPGNTLVDQQWLLIDYKTNPF